MLRAAYKRPEDNFFFPVTIEDDLETLQEMVDGNIEMVTVGQRIVIICNEMGRLRDMDYCCTINGTSFYGPVLICGRDGEVLDDLPLSAEFWDF